MSKKVTCLILVTAANLRLAVAAITPLFTIIQRSEHVSATLTALLVTIPLLCFATGALLTPYLIRRWGMRPLLLGATGLLTFANLWRPWSIRTLLCGTGLIGLAIALLNVLVPALVAQTATTARQATRLTSAYTVIMNAVAASGTALAQPLAHYLGWSTVLGSFGLPALAAFGLTLWIPLPTVTTTRSSRVSLLTVLVHDRVARRLCLFMGLQSTVYYSLVTWLPTIFHQLGAATSQAGLLAAIFQIVGIPAALVLFHLSPQHVLILLTGSFFSGFLLLSWPITWWLAAGVWGFAGSLVFSLALTTIATSSQSTVTIANRSALAQAGGYLMAAGGPALLGRLTTSSQLLMLALFIGATLLWGSWTIRQR